MESLNIKELEVNTCLLGAKMSLKITSIDYLTINNVLSGYKCQVGVDIHKIYRVCWNVINVIHGTLATQSCSS